jgi:hypothetical protein
MIQRARVQPELKGLWDGPAWGSVPALTIGDFLERSGPHRPLTQAKVLYSEQGLHTIFRVEDRYVLSIHTRYQDQVCRDSCVEFFVEPIRDRGFFNFEVNAGGTLLLYHCQDKQRTARGGELNTHVDEADGKLVRIYHSMPRVVQPEVAEPTTWLIEWFAPFSIFEKYLGCPVPKGGSTWRGNLYKCGSRMEHWASWANIGPIFNFHQPDFFAPMPLEK